MASRKQLTTDSRPPHEREVSKRVSGGHLAVVERSLTIPASRGGKFQSLAPAGVKRVVPHLFSPETPNQMEIK